MGKKIISIIMIVILIASIGAGLYLIKHPQILKSRAGGGGPIFYIDSSGTKHTDCSTAGVCTTSSSQVKLNLDSSLLDPNRWTNVGTSPTP